MTPTCIKKKKNQEFVYSWKLETFFQFSALFGFSYDSMFAYSVMING